MFSVPLGTIAIEAGGGGAVAAKGFEPGTEILAGAMENHAGVIGGETEGVGGVLNRFFVEIDPTKQFRGLGLEGVDDAIEAGAELGLPRGGRRGGLLQRDHEFAERVVAPGHRTARAVVVNNRVAQQLIKPCPCLAGIVQRICRPDSLSEAVLEDVFGIGNWTHAGSNERFECSALRVECGDGTSW